VRLRVAKKVFGRACYESYMLDRHPYRESTCDRAFKYFLDRSDRFTRVRVVQYNDDASIEAPLP
jgi:hypothetical protein